VGPRVLFEDEHILAIDKPAGIAVHPTPHGGESLAESVLAYAQGKLARAAGEGRPGLVHRLDRETSGVLLFAKDDGSYQALVQQFLDHRVMKFYDALAQGCPGRDSGIIDAPIGRDPRHRTRMAVLPRGRTAHSEWVVRGRFLENFTHLSVKITTGRTHQIRVHLASIGHPILGDRLYGFIPEKFPSLSPERNLLHASEICFFHPVSGEAMAIRAPRPLDMEQLIGRARAGSH
jgi:23S rRNA pseudouridine1911/1915/1917 synthase